jgi:hypothetical protein
LHRDSSVVVLSVRNLPLSDNPSLFGLSVSGSIVVLSFVSPVDNSGIVVDPAMLQFPITVRPRFCCFVAAFLPIDDDNDDNLEYTVSEWFVRSCLWLCVAVASSIARTIGGVIGLFKTPCSSILCLGVFGDSFLFLRRGDLILTDSVVASMDAVDRSVSVLMFLILVVGPASVDCRTIEGVDSKMFVLLIGLPLSVLVKSSECAAVSN